MTDIRESEPRSGLVSRRTIARTAAWSVPAVAVVAAAPPASASVSTSSVALTGNVTSLLALRVLSSQTVLTARAPVTVPTALTITNGPGALNETATVTVVVGRPAGVNITVGRAHGFGVDQFNGVATSAGQRTATYVNNLGFPATQFTTTLPVALPSNGSVDVPIVWGLAGSRAGLSIDVAATFPVTVSVVFASVTRTATSAITVPAGAGIF
ncbi:MAG: hypothetical protein PIR53_13670 [Nocardioides alkalitolerans]